MTFVRLMEFLHETGLDVFLLGLLNGFISALVEKLPERYGKKLPAKLLAGLPFLLGILLYSLWFVAAVRDFSDAGAAAALIARCGFGTGITAVALRALPSVLSSAATGGTSAKEGEANLRSAVFRKLLSGYLEEPELSDAAAELAAPPAENAEGTGETSEILGKYLPDLPEAERTAFARLLDAVRRYPDG